MKKLIFIIVLLLCALGCGQGQKRKSVIIKEIKETDYPANDDIKPNDPDNAVKDWFLDNPHCSGYMDSLVEGEMHPLFIRKYERMPHPDDYEENESMYRIYTIGHYQVFSRWRGDVFAHDLKTDDYFLVWTDLLHYNTKYIEDLGDNWIRIVYGENYYDDGKTDAIVYNLDTHTYYYSRVDYSYEKYNSW